MGTDLPRPLLTTASRPPLGPQRRPITEASKPTNNSESRRGAERSGRKGKKCGERGEKEERAHVACHMRHLRREQGAGQGQGHGRRFAGGRRGG